MFSWIEEHLENIWEKWNICPNVLENLIDVHEHCSKCSTEMLLSTMIIFEEHEEHLKEKRNIEKMFPPMFIMYLFDFRFQMAF